MNLCILSEAKIRKDSSAALGITIIVRLFIFKKSVKEVIKMRIGVCIPFDKLEAAEKLGFDYVEFGASRVYALSDAEFDALKARVEKCGIKPECYSGMFPSGFRLVGKDETPQEQIKEYLHKTFSRIKALRGRLVVFGSSGARNRDRGYKPAKAYGELTANTRLIGNIAAEYGLYIAIEPLNSGETNMINTLREGADLRDAVGLQNVGLLADFYHLRKEREDMREVLAVGRLIHVHVARKSGRRYPKRLKEDCYEDFFNNLKKINYNGGVSIEATASSFKRSSKKAIALLRGLMGRGDEKFFLKKE